MLSVTACEAGAGAERVEQRRLVPTVHIGSETTGTAYLFTEIRQVVASDSQVFVLPSEEPEIRVFDVQGRHRRTIGRRGAGPGEFDAVSAMGLSGDTLWTLDSNLRRISRFGGDGALLTTQQLESMSPEVGSPGVYYFFYPMAVLPDGALVGFGGTTGRAIASGQVKALPILRISAGAGAADTIGWVPIGNEHLILTSSRGTMYRAQPFADAPLTAYAPSTSRVYVVERYAARDETDADVRVTAIDTRGDTVWSKLLPYQPRPLAASVVDSVRAYLTRVLAPRFPASEINRRLFVPLFRSPVTHVLSGADGSLWVAWDSAGDQAQRYTVLSADGRVAFDVSAPRDTHLVWARRDMAWGEVRDANGVPTLVRFRVVPVQ